MEYFDSDYEKYDDMENPKRGVTVNDIDSEIELLESRIKNTEERISRIHEYFDSPEDIEYYRNQELKFIYEMKKKIETLKKMKNNPEIYKSQDEGSIDLYDSSYEDGNTELFELYEDEYTTDLFQKEHKKI